VSCPYCGDVFELDESRVTKGLKSSSGSPLIRVPCCSCGRMFEITLSAVKEEHSLIEAVDRLIKIYENHPEGLYPDAPDRSKV
jgi:hypothetical protein